MSLHMHHLRGCAPVPLALYLKAIGILRLVAEQLDPDARGWWQDEHFCLLTKLDQSELEQFFLDEYSPTAVFNPWGGRSGFYDDNSEKNTRVALSSIEEANMPRLSDFKKSIDTVRRAIESLGGVKPESKEAKSQLVGEIRRQLRGAGSEWLATVLADLGDESFGPPLFGTGGNEGSGSYTAAFFAAIRECLVQRSWDDSLSASLFQASEYAARSWDGSFYVSNPKNRSKLKKESVKGPFRQFLPEGQLSPWDLILMFEGACAFRSGVSKRGSSQSNDRLVSSPFYFAPHGVGAPTSCDSDEFVINKGRRQPGRGEQWFPLWKAPTSYAEFHALLAEGRCSIGRRRARKPIDGVRAVGRLGVNRGVTEFIRYGYLQRNNLATH
ncbi:MAG: type I-U CRISPR-associated protein Csx17, partial [Planctomycetes bacterium]|nr:type I-U CRISPR-associated protein Csx17 [Planctomycetota bacterium]